MGNPLIEVQYVCTTHYSVKGLKEIYNQEAFPEQKMQTENISEKFFGYPLNKTKQNKTKKNTTKSIVSPQKRQVQRCPGP